MKKAAIYILIIVLSVISAYGLSINPASVSFTPNAGDVISGSFNISTSEDASYSMPSSFELSNYGKVDISLSSQSGVAAQTKTISYQFTVPSGAYYGFHTGKLDIQNNITGHSYFTINLNINKAPGISVNVDKVSFGNVFQNKTGEGSFTVTNTGNADLTNVQLSSNANSRYQLTFSPSQISAIKSGESKTVTVTIKIPSNEPIANDVLIGSLTIKSDQSTKTVSNFFTTNVGSYLELQRVRVEVGEETNIIDNGQRIPEDASPKEKIRFEIGLKNLYPDYGQEVSIDNVEVTLTAIGLDVDNEDLEITSDTFDLDYEGNQKKHTFEIEFNIPADAESGRHDIEIQISAEDEYGNQYDMTWNSELNVERELHNLIIDKFTLSSQKISCNRQITADFTIGNYGRTDEDLVRYTLESKELGINEEKNRIELVSDEDENTLSEMHPINLNSVKPGTYEIDLKIYRENDILTDASGIKVTIQECGASGNSNSDTNSDINNQNQNQQQPNQTNNINQNNNAQTNTNQNTQTGQQQTGQNSQSTTQIKQPVKTESNVPVTGTVVQEPFKEIRDSNSYAYLLIAVNAILILSIMGIIILYIRR